MRTAIRRHARLLGLVIAGPLVVINLLVRGPDPAPLASGPATTEAVDAWLADRVRDAGIPGAAIVIVRDGRIVDERGFGTADATGRPVDATTPFVIGSLSKSITALAVMQLVDAGRVSLDAPVRHYLPEFSVADPTAGERITVRQLLTHTSGLPTSAGVAPLSTAPTTLADRVGDLRWAGLASRPGAAYAYSNANYLVLGRLVEVVSGEPFGAYLRAHVFDPLGMAHAATDRRTAIADGLGDAHRLWFGLAAARAPIDRPDLVPAGFITASADDLGRFLIAELDGGRYGTTRVVSEAAIATMQTGTVATGIGDERIGMGWVESTLDGERMVAHAGSTTDMASVQILIPGRRLGVAVLFNAQSTLYELLHKPEMIGLGAASLLIGRQPAGTLQAFYPAFDVAVLGLLGWLVLGLIRTVRRPAVPSAPRAARTTLGRLRFVGSRVALVYLDVVVPAVILIEAPELLGAPWTTLVRIDLGAVLAALVAVRLADGGIRVARVALGRRAMRSPLAPGARSASGAHGSAVVLESAALPGIAAER